MLRCLESVNLSVFRSFPSAHSQLSYKPFSPKAPSLPPGLLPLREPPLDVETSRVSIEKKEHPAIVDTNGSIPRPEEERSLDGRGTYGKAPKEREEETVDDKEGLLQILQMAAEEQNSKKETLSLAEKDDVMTLAEKDDVMTLAEKDDVVTLADKQHASLAEYAEIELPVERSSPVIQKETTLTPERKAVPSSPDTSSREIRGVESKDEDDVADDDDDDEESGGDDEDDMDDEDDSFHA